MFLLIFQIFSNFETPKVKLRMNNTKINVRATFAAVLLTDCVDLGTLVAAQLREITRVLGSQGAPTEPDIDPVRHSIQGILSIFMFSGILKIL